MNILPAQHVNMIAHELNDTMPRDFEFTVIVVSNETVPDMTQMGMYAFAYTVGLGMYNMPDLIAVGMTGQVLAQVLTSLGDHARNNGAFEDGWVDTELTFGNFPVMVKDLSPSQHAGLTQIASKFYEHKRTWPSYQQVVLPDRHGILPDNAGYDSHYMREHYGQILLYENGLAEAAARLGTQQNH